MPDKENYIVHLSAMEMDAVTVPLNNRKDAEKIASDCRGRMCQVEKDHEELVKIEAPKLYNLPDLQKEAERLFGYTAGQTRDVVMSLHEKKLLTYPETDSCYLPYDMGYTAEKLAIILLEELPFTKGYPYKPNVNQLLNIKQKEGEHAILPIPLEKGWETLQLNEQEWRLLLLVGARVLLAAADAHIYEKHKSQLTCNYHTFFIEGKRVRQEGYREIERKMEAFFKAGNDGQEEKKLEIYLGKVFGPCETSIEVVDAAV